MPPGLRCDSASRHAASATQASPPAENGRAPKSPASDTPHRESGVERANAPASSPTPSAASPPPRSSGYRPARTKPVHLGLVSQYRPTAPELQAPDHGPDDQSVSKSSPV